MLEMGEILKGATPATGSASGSDQSEVGGGVAPAVGSAQSQSSAPPVEPTTEEGKGSPTGVVTAPASADAQDQHDDEEEVPDDVERLKKALTAARGDKRKAKKLWREAESQVAAINKQFAELRGRAAAYEHQFQQLRQGAPQAQPMVQHPDHRKTERRAITMDDFLVKGPETVMEYVEQTIEEERQRYSGQIQELNKRFLEQSEAYARQRHDDYDVVIKNVNLAPDVYQTIVSSPDPGEARYQYAKTFEQLRDVPSLDAYRAKVEAELRQRIETEMAEKFRRGTPAPGLPQAPAPKPSIPQSLAGARGFGVGQPTSWVGPRPMSEILRRSPNG